MDRVTILPGFGVGDVPLIEIGHRSHFHVVCLEPCFVRELFEEYLKEFVRWMSSLLKGLGPVTTGPVSRLCDRRSIYKLFMGGCSLLFRFRWWFYTGLSWIITQTFTGDVPTTCHYWRQWVYWNRTNLVERWDHKVTLTTRRNSTRFVSPICVEHPVKFRTPTLYTQRWTDVPDALSVELCP